MVWWTEFISRAGLTGLGADGSGSWVTFGIGGALTGTSVYEWRSDAGDTLMNSGFENFKSLYNQEVSDPLSWDINQIKTEQSVLQGVHEEHLSDNELFQFMSKTITNTDITPIDDAKGQSGGVDLLDYNSRIEYGCRLLGYGADQGCAP